MIYLLQDFTTEVKEREFLYNISLCKKNDDGTYCPPVILAFDASVISFSFPYDFDKYYYLQEIDKLKNAEVELKEHKYDDGSWWEVSLSSEYWQAILNKQTNEKFYQVMNCWQYEKHQQNKIGLVLGNSEKLFCDRDYFLKHTGLSIEDIFLLTKDCNSFLRICVYDNFRAPLDGEELLNMMALGRYKGRFIKKIDLRLSFNNYDEARRIFAESEADAAREDADDMNDDGLRSLFEDDSNNHWNID